jgi:hypothetical protein
LDRNDQTSSDFFRKVLNVYLVLGFDNLEKMCRPKSCLVSQARMSELNV